MNYSCVIRLRRGVEEFILRLLRYFLNVVIVGFWIVMMGLLVSEKFLPATISPLEIRFPEKLPHTENWGIYTNGERIGYTKIEFQEYPLGGYVWEGTTKVEMPFFLVESWSLPGVGEEKIPISIRSSILFDSTARLKDFDMEILFYDLAINIKGQIVNDMLMLLYKTGGKEAKYTLFWTGNSEIINNGLFPWFYRTRLRVGDKFQWRVFNPLTQSMELVKAVVQRSTLYYHKEDFLSVLVVTVWYQNTKMEFWVDENGNPLKIHTPWGWELIAE